MLKKNLSLDPISKIELFLCPFTSSFLYSLLLYPFPSTFSCPASFTMLKSTLPHSFLYLIVLLFTFNAVLTLAYPLEERSSSFSGDGTFYTVGLGSCGKTNTDTELVAALSSDLMSDGKYCGKKIKITTSTGTVTATVVDTCPGCAKGSVDLSPSAFKKIGKVAAGRIAIKWSFLWKLCSLLVTIPSPHPYTPNDTVNYPPFPSPFNSVSSFAYSPLPWPLFPYVPIYKRLDDVVYPLYYIMFILIMLSTTYTNIYKP